METNSVQYYRVKEWQLALSALCGCVTTIFPILMTFASYIATGVYGATTVAAGMIISGTRVFDGITDPVIALFTDRLNGKFGRIRPLLVLGYIVMCFSVFMMYVVYPAKGNLFVFAIVYILYIIGYTLFGVGLHMTGAVLTNDPKQRPRFNRWNTTYTTILSTMFSVVLASTLMPKHNYKYGPALFSDLCYIVVILGAILVVISVVAITLSGRDVPSSYVNAKKEPVRPKEIWNLLVHNRAMQAYIVAAASDKLALQVASQSAVTAMIFGIVIGNYKFNSQINIANMIVTLLMINLFTTRLAGNKGMKYALTFWTGMSIFAYAATFIFMLCVDTLQITVNPILKYAFIALYCLMGAMKMSTSCISRVCQADIIDYEFSRTGKYMPGVVTSTYTFIDKLISSLSSTVVAISVAAIGYVDAMPQASDPFTRPVFMCALFLWLGLPIIGYLCTIIAMKFYPLDKKTMEEVQAKNAEMRIAAAK